MTKTILYLEDATDLQQIVQKILSNDGHEVVGVCNPEDAYRVLSDGVVPDIILMDLSIPEMEPFDFVSTLEKRFPHFNAPIVVASGHEDASKIARCLGAIATLQKPFQLEELSMTIFAVLESAEERRAMGQHKPLSREITL